MTAFATTEPANWPKSLDALRAAPHHHTLVFENDKVRVLDTRISPGDIVPLHTHRWPAVLHILSWADFVRRDEEGRVLTDTRGQAGAPPHLMWAPPLGPHTLENVGESLIHVVAVEVKGG